jgi:hypothetical protein
LFSKLESSQPWDGQPRRRRIV